MTNNTGNTTQLITRNMYEQFGVEIPGAPSIERSMKFYMRSTPKGTADTVTHEGPSVVLVNDLSWDSFTPVPTPTPTSKPTYYNDDDTDPLSGLTSGGMAGVIIGILVAIVIIIALSCWCGCCACCGVKKRAGRAGRARMDEEGQAKIVAQGTELMQQKGTSSGTTRPATLDPGRPMGAGSVGVARTTREDGDEIRRVEDGVRDQNDPPPRYTP